jgi:multidrug efflux pump
MRQAMGVAVFWGMLGVTLFSIFFTPVFYVMLRRLSGNRPLTRHDTAEHIDAEGATGGVLAITHRTDA